MLVVDQCEEAFAPSADAAEPARFCDVLTQRAERGQVVVALRADRLTDVSAYPGFARLIERGLYLLGPLDDAGLRAAIERPARQAGLVVEPGLVGRPGRRRRQRPGCAAAAVARVARDLGAPRRTHAHRRRLSRASGGIRGSIAQSAEGVYASVAGPSGPRCAS